MIAAWTAVSTSSRFSPAGIVSTLVGTGVPGDDGDGGPASAATFGGGFDLALDAAHGILYFSDTGNNRIVRVTSIAGGGWIAYGTAGAGSTNFQAPAGIALH